MRKSTVTLPHLLIPIVTITVVYVISMSPWGATFRTNLLHGEELHSANIVLAELDHAKVRAHVAEENGGAYIELQIAGTPTKEQMHLTLPAAWQLQEVRGVHAKDITRFDTVERVTYYFPNGTENVELTLVTSTIDPFIAFVHDRQSPALFSLTHLELPQASYTQNVQVVGDTALFAI